MELEPTNKYDSNAIKILNSSGDVWLCSKENQSW